MSRFDYVKYDQQSTDLQDHFKKQVTKLEKNIQEIGAEGMKKIDGKNAAKKLTDAAASLGRSKAMAITCLEEFYMWTGKAVRDEQILRNGIAELQEQRKDG